jgi:hypothetical protein
MWWALPDSVWSRLVLSSVHRMRCAPLWRREAHGPAHEAEIDRVDFFPRDGTAAARALVAILYVPSLRFERVELDAIPNLALQGSSFERGQLS